MTASYADAIGEDKSVMAVIPAVVDLMGMVTLSSSRPVVDTALTASLTDSDGGVTGVMWQWASSDAMDGTWTDISGATSDSYTPMAGDAGNYLQATASYADAIGEDKSAMAVTATVVDLMGMVTLSSSQPVVDTALTASLTDPDGGVTGVMWQWAISDAMDGTWTDISGATSDSYTPMAGDAGNYLQATASYADAIGEDKSAMAVTATVTAADLMGMVTLSSSRPVVDTALTASLTDADGGVTGVMWQWASSDAMDGTWTDISGATSDSYTPWAGDEGNYLQATASYADAIGEDKSAMAVTAVVVYLRVYGPGEELASMPTGVWTPDFQWGASHEIVDGASTVTFEHGGRIEEEGITYSCLSSGGCTIAGTRVTGMVQVSLTADESDLVRAGMGEQKTPVGGTMFMDHTYNGFELRASTVTLRSVAGEVTRLSFLDINGDVVFVDFSSDSSDTEVVVTLEDYMDPLDGSPYNQPDSWYAMGLATVHVVNPTEMTWLKVTSIGNDPMLVDPAIVMEDTFMTANGWAEIRKIDVHHDAGMGSIGAIHAANVNFSAMDGVVGIDAMDTVVMMALSIGDLTLEEGGTAMPYLRISGDSLAMGDMVIEEILIAGGDLAQATPDNQVDTGGQIFKIMAVDGMGTIDAMIVPAATGTFVTDPDAYFLTNGQMIVMEEEMASN